MTKVILSCPYFWMYLGYVFFLGVAIFCQDKKSSKQRCIESMRRKELPECYKN